MNKILRVRYDARSFKHLLENPDKHPTTDAQFRDVFQRYHLRPLSYMGIYSGSSQSCLIESYQYKLEFVPNVSVIVYGDPRQFDLMISRAAPNRVFFAFEEIELPESLLQLYNINTQEKQTMANKTNRVLIPYFTATGDQYWYDTINDQVGVGVTPHATRKSTYLFAQRAGAGGAKIRPKNRIAVHISTIRAEAQKASALSATKASGPAVATIPATGAWPQPVRNTASSAKAAAPAASAAQPAISVPAASAIAALEHKIDVLTATLRNVEARLAQFDGFVRK